MSRFLALALILGAPSLAAADAGPTFAVVHVKKAMESSKHWKQAAKKLEAERTAKQTALEKKQAVLKEKKAQLDARKALADPASVAADEEALFRDAQLLSREFMANQQQLSILEKKVTDQMLTRLEAIVREVAAQGDYSFVFDAGSDEKPNVLHAKRSIDITKQVIKLYKKHFGDKPLKFE